MHFYSSLFAADIYGSCGARPEVLEGLFTQAKKIREKCIDDIYEEQKKQTQKEIEDLLAMNKALDTELKKYAYKIEYNLIRCRPTNGDAVNPVREKKCREIVDTQNSILRRVDTLNGWNIKPAKKESTQNISVESLTPPCPSQDELKKMQVARMFNKKLFQTYDRCTHLAE